MSSVAQRSNCPGNRNPGSLTRLTRASTKAPGVLWISPFPQRKKILRRVQYTSRLPAKYVRWPWATVCRFALEPALAPRHHLLQLERRSGKGRRDRRSRIGGCDISLPLAPWKGAVVALGCGKRGNLGAGKDYPLRWFLRHPGLRPAQAHRSCFYSWGQRGEQAASPLASSCCRWPPSTLISFIRTWTSRMSLTISCSAGHSTSWWLDHRHPHSRLIPGIRSKSTGSRSRLQESAVWTRPKPSACASPICWRSEPQRRAALRVHGRGEILFCSPDPDSSSLFDMAPCVELARARARRTDFKLPSVDINRPTFGQAQHWKVEVVDTGSPLGAPSGAQSAPLQGWRWSAAATRTPLGLEVLCSLPVTPASLTPALQPLSPNTCARTPPLRARKPWDRLGRGARELLPHGNAHASS